ncbi:tyrosine-type recombinase/integrase [Parapedobacter sp. SGR-10]|uniref:tyrosine-type recombinase/integrase n=1 Tax=Parapedobacter sp. SGR-10 TaxID=2710879 RepID=UPI001F0DA8C1|nr:tyrosine-type recombinase/integrase [Parapedobacter sp. SGR-10]
MTYLTHEKRCSLHTITAYEMEINRFIAFVERESVPFEEIDHKLVRYYLATMKEEGKEAVTINRAISALRSYYKFLLRENLVKSDPMRLVQVLKTPKKLPTVVEKDKLNHLLESWEKTDDDFENYRDFIVMELLFGTGIRLSELLKIKEYDIDFFNKKIRIFGKRSKERFVPMHTTLIDELKKYITQKKQKNLANISDCLVVTKEGKQAYPKLIYRIVQKYLSMITSQKKRSPHVLRHSFATSLLDNGADLNAIKELLGHAGLASTQVYTHNSAERLKSIYKQAHPKA